MPLDLYEPGGVTLLADFSLDIVAGTPSEPVTFELWNSPGNPAADIATGIFIHLFERRVGETDWTQERDLTGRRLLEIQAVGTVGSGGADPQVTEYTPTGQGRPFAVSPIPGDAGRVFNIRADVTAAGAPGSGEGDDSVEIKIRVTAAEPFVTIAEGLHSSGLRGLPTGLGDGAMSYVVSGGDLAASGPPDGNARLSAVVAVVQGARVSLPPAAIPLDGNAADGALAAGQSYLATISLSAAGVTVTKSNKGASPLPIEDRPPTPDGELVLGWVERLEGATIGAGNITSAPALGGFALQVAGLAAQLAPGLALVDDRLIRRDAQSVVTLPDSTAWALYLLPVGTFAITTDGSRPDPRALELYRGVSGPVSLISLQDVRPWLRSRPGALAFSIPGPLAVDDAAYAVYGGDADGVPTIPFSVRLALRDNGIATTGAETKVDVERYDGAAWVSLFPSSGTSDIRPAIDHAAAGRLTVAASAETAVLSPGDLVRARIVEIPTGGTSPSGAEVILQYEEP